MATSRRNEVVTEELTEASIADLATTATAEEDVAQLSEQVSALVSHRAVGHPRTHTPAHSLDF